MKKRTNKKLALNKQKISELSEGNLKEVKGGCTCKCTIPRFECGLLTDFGCPPPKTKAFVDCETGPTISFRICIEK